MKTLFMRLLGDAFDTLPPAVRALHSTTARKHFTGVAKVEGGWGARLLGFPRSGYNLPIRFTLEPLADGRERWIRDFDTGHRFITVLGAHQGNLIECWARIVKIELSLQPSPEGIDWRIASLRVCGLLMPKFLWPQIEAHEKTEKGQYHFSVSIKGLISLFYEGWLTA